MTELSLAFGFLVLGGVGRGLLAVAVLIISMVHICQCRHVGAGRRGCNINTKTKTEGSKNQQSQREEWGSFIACADLRRTLHTRHISMTFILQLRTPATNPKGQTPKLCTPKP